jgi:hypothetical protein
MSRTFKVIVTCIFCLPLVLLGAAGLMVGNPGTKMSSAAAFLIGAIPLVFVARWGRRGRPPAPESSASLDMYDPVGERLDESRNIYGGMTQRDMNDCCDTVRAYILDNGLKDRKLTNARDVQKLLRDCFRTGLHQVDAEDAIDDKSADIFGFFKSRGKVHKKATRRVLAGPLDAPEVISIFALEMLNGKRVGRVYLEWRAMRTT